MNITNIPAHRDFCSDIAAYVLSRISDSADIKKTCVFLPNQRSSEHLKNIFLSRNIALPKIFSLGDIHLNILRDFYVPIAHLENIKIISAFERQLHLTQLTSKFPCLLKDNKWTLPSMDLAFKLALSLGDLLDELYIAKKDIHHIQDTTQAIALHLENNMSFIKIISEYWPQISKDLNGLDKVLYQQLLFKTLIEHWQKHPPENHIIFAGSMASHSHTRELAIIISRFRKGHILLSMIDREIEEQSWNSLSPTHPQYCLSQLLQNISIKRTDIMDLALDNALDSQAGKTRSKMVFLSQAFRPSDTLHQWSPWLTQIMQKKDNVNAIKKALENITFIEAQTLINESYIIFSYLKDSFLNHKRVCLITNNNDLISFVKTHCEEEQIPFFHPSSLKFSETQYGQFFLLIARLAYEKFSTALLLSLLKHEMVHLTCFNKEERLQLTYKLEKNYLRGPKNNNGLKSLLFLIKDEPALCTLIKEVQTIFQPLAQGQSSEKSLTYFLDAHLQVFLNITADSVQDNSLSISFFQEIEKLQSQNIYDSIPFEFSEYVLFMDSFIKQYHFFDEAICQNDNKVFILSPIEARLLKFDRVILGSVNESSWPQQEKTDIWLSRYIKNELSLDWTEKQRGLSNHDFWYHLLGDEVIITRATRVDGQPTTASRWWIRIMSLLDALNISGVMCRTDDWNQKLHNKYKALPYKPHIQPAPKPPLSARPFKISVTKVEKLMRDPYAYYADQILKLRPLPPLDEAPQNFDYGRLVHKIFESFILQYKTQLPNNALDKLVEIGKKVFAEMGLHPEIEMFWWPKFLQTAAWFIQEDSRKNQEIQQKYCEITGKLAIQIQEQTFFLTAKADRIDHLMKGTSNIIDYKTGALPTMKEVLAGYAPQLPLEGLILENNGFNIAVNSPIILSYWRLKSYNQAGEIRNITFTSELSKTTYEGVKNLLIYFHNEEHGYSAQPTPELAPQYSDFDHLARIDEWRKNA